jgi:hypothetical protein
LARARSADAYPAATPDLRKRVLVDAFERAVSRVGHYSFVANLDIRRPDRDRTLYLLVYGTRQPSGIKVFRDCHVKSLGAQAEVLARKTVADRLAASNQFELLGSMHDMAPDPNRAFLAAEDVKARSMLLDIVPASGNGVRWSTVWPRLAKNVVRLTDPNRAANEFRKDGSLAFPSWGGGRKSVPEDDYLVLRGPMLVR